MFTKFCKKKAYRNSHWRKSLFIIFNWTKIETRFYDEMNRGLYWIFQAKQKNQHNYWAIKNVKFSQQESCRKTKLFQAQKVKICPYSHVCAVDSGRHCAVASFQTVEASAGGAGFGQESAKISVKKWHKMKKRLSGVTHSHAISLRYWNT